MMFTDWSQTDPKYFFMRGIVYGIVLCLMITQIGIPVMRKWIKKVSRMK